MKVATDIRVELLDVDRKIGKLLNYRVAIQNFRVKQLLLGKYKIIIDRVRKNLVFISFKKSQSMSLKVKVR